MSADSGGVGSGGANGGATGGACSIVCCVYSVRVGCGGATGARGAASIVRCADSPDPEGNGSRLGSSTEDVGVRH